MGAGAQKDGRLWTFGEFWRRHCVDASQTALNPIRETCSVEGHVTCAAKQCLIELPQHDRENPLGMVKEMTVIIAGSSIFAVTMRLTYFPAGVERRPQLKENNTVLGWTGAFTLSVFVFPPRAHFLHFHEAAIFKKKKSRHWHIFWEKDEAPFFFQTSQPIGLQVVRQARKTNQEDRVPSIVTEQQWGHLKIWSSDVAVWTTPSSLVRTIYFWNISAKGTLARDFSEVWMPLMVNAKHRDLWTNSYESTSVTQGIKTAVVPKSIPRLCSGRAAHPFKPGRRTPSCTAFLGPLSA